MIVKILILLLNLVTQRPIGFRIDIRVYKIGNSQHFTYSIHDFVWPVTHGWLQRYTVYNKTFKEKFSWFFTQLWIFCHKLYLSTGYTSLKY